MINPFNPLLLLLAGHLLAPHVVLGADVHAAAYSADHEKQARQNDAGPRFEIQFVHSFLMFCLIRFLLPFGLRRNPVWRDSSNVK